MDPESSVVEPTQPVEAVVDTPVVEPVAVDPVVETTEPDPDPRPQKGDHISREVFNRRVADLYARQKESEAELERARREAADAKALIERLSKGERADSTSRTEPVKPTSSYQDEVQKEAERLVLYRTTERIKQRGAAEFGPDYQENLNAIVAVGVDDPFIADVLAVDEDRAHVLFKALSDDLDKTLALTKMEPRRRIAELTKMSIAAHAEPKAPVVEPAKTAPVRVVSKAPAPAPVVTPTAKVEKDWREDHELSDAEWSKRFDAEFGKRKRV